MAILRNFSSDFATMFGFRKLEMARIDLRSAGKNVSRKVVTTVTAIYDFLGNLFAQQCIQIQCFTFVIKQHTFLCFYSIMLARFISTLCS